VGRWKAGGGTGDVATASGGEVQLEQEAGGVARRGEASARAGERRGKWGTGTWLGLGQRRGGRAAHMAGHWWRRAAEEKQRRGRER
jgi:hypothetical protein